MQESRMQPSRKRVVALRTDAVLGEPGVLQGLLGADAAAGITLQHRVDELHALCMSLPVSAGFPG